MGLLQLLLAARGVKVAFEVKLLAAEVVFEAKLV